MKKNAWPHDCIKNYGGSSKGMESAACLEIAVNAPGKGFVLAVIVSDDDTTMRAHLKHPHVGDKKGKLPLHIYSPEFLADPSHRKKVVAKHFYALASAPVLSSRVTNDLAKRMKKNWGYMLRQNVNSLLADFVKNAKAPLAHVFGNHEHCSNDWCQVLQAQKDNKVYNHPQGWLSVENPQDKKIYDQLHAITSKYGNEHYLRQSRHAFNTQTNEALNQSQARVTPKSRVFHKSKAFHYWHANVVGCHNFGYKRYWLAHYTSLGIFCSASFVRFLERVENRKKRVKANSERPEVKRKRAHRQEATEKNYYTKAVHQNMDPELDWILVLQRHGVQGKKGKTYRMPKV